MSITYAGQLPTPSIPPTPATPLVNAPAGMAVPIQGLSPLNYWAQFGGLVFGCIDQLGIKWHFNDPDGWMDGTTVALAQIHRGHAHGAWLGQTFLEPRLIKFEGHVEAPNAILAWQARNVLLGVAAATTIAGIMDADTTLAVNEPDALKTASVRSADRPSVSPVDGSVFSFSLPLIARDPRKYGTQYTAITTLPVASSGLSFPVGAFGAGVTFGGTGASGSVALTNNGNFAAPLLFTITGPCTNPFILNLTTGAIMSFGITLGSSDTLVINTDYPSVILNGTASRLNTLQPGSTFSPLPPGTASYQFGASSYSSLASLSVTWNDVWW